MSFSPGNEGVAAPGVQGVDVTAGVVKHSVPEVFGELEGYFSLSKGHLFTVPHVHLAAKVKDQHLLRDAKAHQQGAQSWVESFSVILVNHCCCLKEKPVMVNMKMPRTTRKLSLPQNKTLHI